MDTREIGRTMILLTGRTANWRTSNKKNGDCYRIMEVEEQRHGTESTACNIFSEWRARLNLYLYFWRQWMFSCSLHMGREEEASAGDNTYNVEDMEIVLWQGWPDKRKYIIFLLLTFKLTYCLSFHSFRSRTIWRRGIGLGADRAKHQTLHKFERKLKNFIYFPVLSCSQPHSEEWN